MSSRLSLYHVTPENLALRRGFIGLDEQVVAVLAAARPWAEEVADAIAAQLTDHAFAFPATAAFFGRYAAGQDLAVDDLRAGWQGAHAAHLRAVFAEASSADPFGPAYFDGLLGVGALHNQIELPLKWYLGSYPALLDAVRDRLREQPPADPAAPPARRALLRRRRAGRAAAADFAARVERALTIVFNYDIQAITDAFYFDTFATMGVDLSAFRAVGADRDLSDQAAVLKQTVTDSLQLIIDSSVTVHDVFRRTEEGVAEATAAMGGIADATSRVSDGADRQAEMLHRSRALAQDAASATHTARSLSETGADAASGANDLMQRIRSASLEARAGIDELARKSDEIGGILEAITGIADQTNLLALNAAIEAARAGEHGRGFAVVADEVRKLAEESGRSATSIGGLIGEIQRETQGVVALVQQAADLTDAGAQSSASAQDTFREIAAAIGEITDRVTGIMAAAQEIAGVAETSSASAREVSSATERTSASAEQIRASVAELGASSEQLVRAASRFALG
jgi:methyl-accepting chemotaxis protein